MRLEVDGTYYSLKIMTDDLGKIYKPPPELVWFRRIFLFNILFFKRWDVFIIENSKGNKHNQLSHHIEIIIVNILIYFILVSFSMHIHLFLCVINLMGLFEEVPWIWIPVPLPWASYLKKLLIPWFPFC